MTSAKKIIFVLVAFVALLYAAYRIYLGLVPEHVKIRNLIMEMIEDFNDGDLSSIADGVAEDYKDLTTRLDRDQLLQGLRYAVLNERDAKTRRFGLRVEVVEEPIEVTVDLDTATVALRLRLLRSNRGEWTDAGGVEVQAELGKRDGDWQVVRTRQQWERGSRRPRWK